MGNDWYQMILISNKCDKFFFGFNLGMIYLNHYYNNFCQQAKDKG